MDKIAIIVGSTRPERRGLNVAQWVYDIAQKRGDAEYTLVDLQDHNLPLFDESLPPMMSGGQYDNDHTRRWSEFISGFDGFIFVTPEYNGCVSSTLLNALNFLYGEWNNKAAGIVAYGADEYSDGGYAEDALRLVLYRLQIIAATTPYPAAHLSEEVDIDENKVVNARESKYAALDALLTQTVALTHFTKTTLRGITS